MITEPNFFDANTCMIDEMFFFLSQEPSDAIRVVNALLTQIDAIKRYPNVLIMTTSNVTGTIDVAFVDRADIKHFVGNPSKFAICAMLLGSIEVWTLFKNVLSFLRR